MKYAVKSTSIIESKIGVLIKDIVFVDDLVKELMIHVRFASKITFINYILLSHFFSDNVI